MSGAVRVFDDLDKIFSHDFRRFFRKCVFNPVLRFRFLLIEKIWTHHAALVDKGRIDRCQVNRIHKYLALAIPAVSQLDF